MTRRNKILLAVIAIVVLLVVSFNLFLYFGLTGMAKKFLPDIRKKTGISVDFSRIWATLPGGTLNISDLKIANPEGFSTNDTQFLSIGKGSFNVGLLSLCRGTVRISSIKTQGSRLTLVKNEAGKVNSVAFEEISRSMSPPKQKPPQPPPETGTPDNAPAGNTETKQGNGASSAKCQQPPPASPKTAIGKVRIDTVVEYIDRQISPGKAAGIALALKIKADNITTFGDPEKENGSFSIKGNIEGKPGALVINIKGKTTPIIDPLKPTFSIQGTITNICTADFKELADIIGIESEHIDLDINIQCRQGTFVRGISSLNAKIKKLKVTGKSAGKMQGMNIDYLSVSIPLKGTVDKPDIDIIGALLSNLTGNVDKLLRSINVDQKSVDKTVTSFFNSILGGKKKK